MFQLHYSLMNSVQILHLIQLPDMLLIYFHGGNLFVST